MSTLAPKHPTSFFIYKPSENCSHLLQSFTIKLNGSDHSLSLYLCLFLSLSFSFSITFTPTGAESFEHNLNTIHGTKLANKYQKLMFQLASIEFRSASTIGTILLIL